MPAFDILICGAGIAGPTLALLLAQSNVKHNITVLERSPVLRTTGQQVDLRLSGITIMRRLGLLDNLKAITIEETGVAMVDSTNRVKADFPVEKDGESQSFSSEYEILRGKFAGLLFEKTNGLPNVRYIFGDRVEAMEQKGNKVDVTFKNGTPSARYDLVVAADGMRSRTRDIAWAQTASPTTKNTIEESQSPLKSMNLFMAYFSLPISDNDLQTAGTGMARWYNAPGRRGIFVRPDHRGKKHSSAYLTIAVPPRTSAAPTSDEHQDTISSTVTSNIRQHLESAVNDYTNVSSQKALFRQMFADAGWEVDRFLDGMDKSEDFYFQEIAQIKLSKATKSPHLAWSRGRVVCLGDAGYCPTLLTGKSQSQHVNDAHCVSLG